MSRTLGRAGTRRSRRVEVARGEGFDVIELEAPADGPTVCVVAGVHGDEPEGMLAAHAIEAVATGLEAGRIRLIPCAHEAAQRSGTRVSPLDGGNLARSFPGDAAGGATVRLAAALIGPMLDGVDLLIDLHTGGRLYDMPFLAGYTAAGAAPASASEQAARAFGFPFVWRHESPSTGRTLSAAAAAGTPAIYVEGPGGQMVNLDQVTRYRAGVERVLAALEMLEGDEPAEAAPTVVDGGGNLDEDVVRVSARGYFVRETEPGARLAAGAPLGRTLAPSGRLCEVHVAPHGGHVMYLRRLSAVADGDPIAAIAAS